MNKYHTEINKYKCLNILKYASRYIYEIFKIILSI